MDGRFSISSVLSGAFGTIGSNLLATLGVAFLIGVLPVQILSYALSGSTVIDRASLFTTTGGIAAYFGVLLISGFCSMLVQATLVRVTVAHLRDENVSIGTSLVAGISKILPLLGLTILITLAMIPAVILLVVPAIILYIMWCVASPALVAEDLGIFEAFRRSSELTKGNRWKIFGLFALLVIVIWVMSAIVGVVLVMGGGAEQLQGYAASGSFPIAFTLITMVINTVTAALSGTMIASLYIELRTAKEGPLTDALADVFA